MFPQSENGFCCCSCDHELWSTRLHLLPNEAQKNFGYLGASRTHFRLRSSGWHKSTEFQSERKKIEREAVSAQKVFWFWKSGDGSEAKRNNEGDNYHCLIAGIYHVEFLVIYSIKMRLACVLSNSFSIHGNVKQSQASIIRQKYQCCLWWMLRQFFCILTCKYML